MCGSEDMRKLGTDGVIVDQWELFKPLFLPGSDYSPVRTAKPSKPTGVLTETPRNFRKKAFKEKLLK